MVIQIAKLKRFFAFFGWYLNIIVDYRYEGKMPVIAFDLVRLKHIQRAKEVYDRLITEHK